MSSPGDDARLTDWLNDLAAPTAAPAGGAAAALAGALGAALVEMVAGLTADRPRYAPVHELAARTRAQAHRLRGELVTLAARDATAFDGFTQALALPQRTTEEREVRARARARAFRDGAAVQLDLLDLLALVAELGLEMADRGVVGAVGDAATAVFLAGGAARSACWAVRGNLREAGEATTGQDDLAKAAAGLARVEAAESRLRMLLGQRVG
jgi:formiminotetrahydrofolate cyclodeaminase